MELGGVVGGGCWWLWVVVGGSVGCWCWWVLVVVVVHFRVGVFGGARGGAHLPISPGIFGKPDFKADREAESRLPSRFDSGKKLLTEILETTVFHQGYARSGQTEICRETERETDRETDRQTDRFKISAVRVLI